MNSEDTQSDQLDATPGSWRQMLEATPVRNSAAAVKRRGSDGLSVEVKTIKPGYYVPPISWIMRVPEKRVAHLDRLGAEIWNLCDGVRTVEQIVDQFADNHRLTFHEARVGASSYMKMLVRRGALVMAME